MIKIGKIILAGMLIVASLARTQPARAVSCDDVKFVFARGSGESLGDINYDKWQKEITKRISGSSLRYNFYELGTQSYNGYQYDAVAVSGSVSAIFTMIGAKISAGDSYKFGNSVKNGEQELLAYIRAVTISCPNTKFVLGGYSQGAMLVSHALNYINPNQIIYVTNFGDPKTYLPEGKGNYPDACLGKNLSNYRAYVPDCHAYEGILGSYRPYQLEGFYDKIGLWCNNQDAMCSSGLSIGDHTSYTENGMYERAATKIAERLRATFPEDQDFTVDLSQITSQDVAIILDTSPSMMQGPYDQYLMRVRQLVNEVRSLGGRVALFYYGDFRYFKAQCICDFETCTEEKINDFYNDYAKIGIIGHWWYNSGISATYKAITELNWRAEASKTIIIFTNQNLSTQDMSTDYLLEANQVLGATISIYTQHGIGFEERIVKATGGKAYTEATVGSLSSDITNVAPAEMPTLQYIGTIHQKIHLDASQVALELQQQKSVSPQHARSANSTPLHYDWDLDGDGVFEVLDGDSQISTSYNEPKNGFVQVRVRNEAGDYRIALSQVQIIPELSKSPSPLATLRASAQQLDETSYRIDLDTEADWLIVSINDLVLGKINCNNSRHFVVDDVNRPTVVRLTVFSENAGYGQAVELVLGGELSEDDKNASSPGQTTGSHAPSAPNNATSIIDQTTQLAQSIKPQTLPKVPNAGTANLM